MEKITIDQIGIDAHRRYAVDQETVESKYVTESSMVPPQLEIAGTSMIYSSKWEELFELNVGNTPWAAFYPPPNYRIQRNKFFSHTLTPNFGWSEDEEDEDQEENDEEGERARKKQDESLNALLEMISTRILRSDESALLNLVESVKKLNSFLREINSKKLQYQKG